MYTCISEYMYTCIYICIYMYIYKYTYVYIWMYTYIRIYICLHIYIYIYYILRLIESCMRPCCRAHSYFWSNSFSSEASWFCSPLLDASLFWSLCIFEALHFPLKSLDFAVFHLKTSLIWSLCIFQNSWYPLSLAFIVATLPLHRGARIV